MYLSIQETLYTTSTKRTCNMTRHSIPDEDGYRSESPDSLFSSVDEVEVEDTPPDLYTVNNTSSTSSSSPSPSPIPGLYHIPSLLSTHTEHTLLSQIKSHGYLNPSSGKNQAMLFGRWSAQGGSGLPSWADELVHVLAKELKHREEVRDVLGLWELLFRPGEGESETPMPTTDCRTTEGTSLRRAPVSRQMIINHYTPPEGICAHVDLPSRFDDGIMILSLESGIGMEFTPDDDDADGEGSASKRYGIYLSPLSCVILSGEARWKWKHGICQSDGDWVVGVNVQEDDWVMTQYTEKRRIADGPGRWQWAYYVPRQMRTSVTIRWLSDGADIVGT